MVPDTSSLYLNKSECVLVFVPWRRLLKVSLTLNPVKERVWYLLQFCRSGFPQESLGSPEPATAAGGAGARGPISGFTKHGLNQAISRDGVGVSNLAILDAVNNPTKVISQTGGRTMYVGRDATVVMNSQGQVITTWANGSAGQR